LPVPHRAAPIQPSVRVIAADQDVDEPAGWSGRLDDDLRAAG
jgi:hypothetical protein